MKKVVPGEIRGEFAFNKFSATVGPNSFELEEEDQECCVLLTFWGYSTPPDCSEFRRLLMASPEFHLLKCELEHLTGPLNAMVTFG